MSSARLRMMAAMMGSTPALPYDAKVEYLESGSNCYIDTGISPSTTLKCEITFAVTQNFSFSNAAYIFGAYVASATLYSVALSSSTSIRVSRGSSATNITIPEILEGVTHTVSYKFGEVIYDNSTVGTQSARCESQENKVWIFGRGVDTKTRRLRVYGFKMTDGNTVLRDFIPVRVGTTGYMYDKVSGELFGNGGTGSFTYGNNITT